MQEKHKIYITSAIGFGPTELSAFDHALTLCGVENRNLIALSSVIPSSAKVSVLNGAVNNLPGSWGDRLYVVMADLRTRNQGEEIWAGLGWVQDEENNEGLFVEHHGHTEQEVKTLINDSLKGLSDNRGRDFGEVHYKLAGGVCDGRPMCALAIATYQITDWSNQSCMFT